MTKGLGFLFQPLVGGGSGEGSVGSIVVVVVLPFLKFVVEQVDVVDDPAFEEPVELFGVDPVGAFDLPVQARRGRLDIDMADAFVEQVPVERLPELGPVVGLDLLDFERQLGEDVVDEPDCGLLVMGRVGAKDPQSGAVIDRGVLVVALPACRWRGVR